MSNLRKANPVGLDIPIDQIQKVVYPLKDLWGVDLIGYPRCTILEDGNGEKTIEHYLGGNDYTGNLIYAEGNKFFFLSGETVIQQERPFSFKTTIELYFFLNTKECYPDILHKSDEEVRVDVLMKLSKLSDVIESVDIVHAPDKVFNRFNNRISQNFKYDYRDSMGQTHYFKCIIELKPYNITSKSCN